MSTKVNRENGSQQIECKDKIVMELHAKLEWYTKEATAEEFDPKAVESILYLLDIYEPLEEQYANVDDAWARFEKQMAERGVSDKTQNNACESTEKQGNIADSAKTVKTTARGRQKREVSGNVIGFVRRQKIIVAAVLVVLLLALVGTTQVEAIRQNGFFFWLRQDEEGRQMITSPESLAVIGENVYGERYYNWDEVPEWCLGFLPVDENWQKENMEWQYANVISVGNYRLVKSCYTTLETGEEVLVGLVSYNEKVSVNTEVFDDYSYVGQCGEGEEAPIYVYAKKDRSGTVFYRLCRFMDSEIYFVDGIDLELLQDLMKEFQKK